MKATEQEKDRLWSLYSSLESPKSKKDLLFQAEVMVRAQEALKEDYGISDESTKQPTDNRPAA